MITGNFDLTKRQSTTGNPMLKQSSLSSKLKRAGIKTLPQEKKMETDPLWKGPESDDPQGGITQSMMDGLLSCRVRAKIALIDGLRSTEGFNKNLEYGNLWHICEEALAAKKDWLGPLQKYAQKLARKYPLQQTEAIKWYEVCKRQFPVYIDYWRKHPDVKERTPLLQEEAFKLPYALPSGRIVYLRGKFDSVDLIGKGKSAGIYLQENKTKGDIDEATLQKNLTFDKQTMFYLVALEIHKEIYLQDAPPDPGYAKEWEAPLRGVRYNVIRRPLSGGRGSIRPHAAKQTGRGFTPAESDAHYYDRLLNDYILAEPEYWFMRWTVDVTKSDIERYKTEFLDPFLENVCWWYDLQVGNKVHVSEFDLNCLHYRLPYGVYSPIAEGYETDQDNFLRTGSTVGLERAETLFPELEES